MTCLRRSFPCWLRILFASGLCFFFLAGEASFCPLAAARSKVVSSRSSEAGKETPQNEELESSIKLAVLLFEYQEVIPEFKSSLARITASNSAEIQKNSQIREEFEGFQDKLALGEALMAQLENALEASTRSKNAEVARFSVLVLEEYRANPDSSVAPKERVDRILHPELYAQLDRENAEREAQQEAERQAMQESERRNWHLEENTSRPLVSDMLFRMHSFWDEIPLRFLIIFGTFVLPILFFPRIVLRLRRARKAMEDPFESIAGQGIDLLDQAEAENDPVRRKNFLLQAQTEFERYFSQSSGMKLSTNFFRAAFGKVHFDLAALAHDAGERYQHLLSAYAYSFGAFIYDPTLGMRCFATCVETMLLLGQDPQLKYPADTQEALVRSGTAHAVDLPQAGRGFYLDHAALLAELPETNGGLFVYLDESEEQRQQNNYLTPEWLMSTYEEDYEDVPNDALWSMKFTEGVCLMLASEENIHWAERQELLQLAGRRMTALLKNKNFSTGMDENFMRILPKFAGFLDSYLVQQEHFRSGWHMAAVLHGLVASKADSQPAAAEEFLRAAQCYERCMELAPPDGYMLMDYLDALQGSCTNLYQWWQLCLRVRQWFTDWMSRCPDELGPLVCFGQHQLAVVDFLERVLQVLADDDKKSGADPSLEQAFAFAHGEAAKSAEDKSCVREPFFAEVTGAPWRELKSGPVETESDFALWGDLLRKYCPAEQYGDFHVNAYPATDGESGGIGQTGLAAGSHNRYATGGDLHGDAASAFDAELASWSPSSALARIKNKGNRQQVEGICDSFGWSQVDFARRFAADSPVRLLLSVRWAICTGLQEVLEQASRRFSRSWVLPLLLGKNLRTMCRYEPHISTLLRRCKESSYQLLLAGCRGFGNGDDRQSDWDELVLSCRNRLEQSGQWRDVLADSAERLRSLLEKDEARGGMSTTEQAGVCYYIGECYRRQMWDLDEQSDPAVGRLRAQAEAMYAKAEKILRDSASYGFAMLAAQSGKKNDFIVDLLLKEDVHKGLTGWMLLYDPHMTQWMDRDK